MYKPKLKKVKLPWFSMYIWLAVQDDHYRWGQTAEEAYYKLKEVYDYYHMSF